MTLTATYANVPKTTTLTINPAPPAAVALAALALNPASVARGVSSIGTVTLTAPAPAGGVTVTLTSAKPAVASAPASVVVAAGTTVKTFTVVTRSAGTAKISAKYSGVTKTATLAVTRH